MRRTVLTSVFGIVLLMGCSADGSFSTGIDGSRDIDELSDDDVRQVCRNLEAYLNEYALEPDEVHRAMCTVVGLFAAGTDFPGLSCEQMVADCPLDPLPAWTLDCESWTADAVAGCEATVGELEECVSDMGDGFRAALSEVECSLEGSDDLEAELARIAARLDNPSCEGVDEGCELLDFDVDLDGFL